MHLLEGPYLGDSRFYYGGKLEKVKKKPGPSGMRTLYLMIIRRVLYRNSTTSSNGSFYNTRDRLDPCNPEVFNSAPTNTNVFPWLFLEVVF